MTAKDYPITQKYGWDPNYPLNRGINPATGQEEGFHKGVDYGCPVGTPITVNGIVIGLSGQTGAAYGPHVHVGKWLQAMSFDPKLGGWSFKSAEVTQVSEDAVNGKFVRVQGDGYSWVYLHMSDNTKVKVGQILEGGNMDTITNQQLHDMGTALARTGLHREPSSSTDAHDLGRLFVNKNGQITPETVIATLNHIRTSSTKEWQKQDAKLKSSLSRQTVLEYLNSNLK